MPSARLITLLSLLPFLVACAGLSSGPADSLSMDPPFRDLHQVAGNSAETPEQAFSRELMAFLDREDFHCTHPLHHRYFSARYGLKATPTECPQTLPFRVLSGIDGVSVRRLDPGRVHSIHVLFAGEGEAVMSRFGHLSFRLIVCPEQDRSAQACARNLEEHIVLGFRAQVDEFSISYWSGLFGGYRTYLYANPFMDVYREYAIGEFRELYSLPLKLDPSETRRMVRELSAIHWGHSGDYRFLTNNCSSIAQNYLIQSWERFSQTPAVADVFWRPDSFFDHLRETDLVQSHVLENLKRAEQSGHYFPSTQPAYQKALKLVSRAQAQPHFKSLEDYIATTPPKRHILALEDTGYMEALTRDPRLLTAQLLLEEISAMRYERRLIAEVSSYFARMDYSAIQQSVAEHVTQVEYRAFNTCIIEPIKARMQPFMPENGIPEPDAVAPLLQQPGFCETTEGSEQLQGALASIAHNKLPDWGRIDTAIELWKSAFHNIEFYSALGD